MWCLNICVAFRGQEVFPTLVQFRRKFSWMLIVNQWLTNNANVEEDDMEGIDNVQITVTAPPHAKEHRNHRWDCSAKAKYQQYVCRAKWCRKQVMTCCRYQLGYWLCDEHLMEHAANHSKID